MKRFLLILASFGLIASVSAQDILDGNKDTKKISETEEKIV